MSVIDDYLKKVDPVHRKELERIRELAKRVVPDAKEIISYGMPTLQFQGRSFLGFNVHKNHIGVYPYGGEEIALLKTELTDLGYHCSSGAIQVPFDKPISEALLKEIITHRLKRLA